MYAAEMCPSMGLNRAVMVVGGCEGGPRCAEGGCDGVVWKDGGVASGSVVNRMPVDTGRHERTL